VQGLYWTSRQDDSARAVIRFGDRIADGILQQAVQSRSLLEDERAYGEVLELAALIGVDISARHFWVSSHTQQTASVVTG